MPRPAVPGSDQRGRRRRGRGRRLRTAQERSAGGLVLDRVVRPEAAALIGRIDRKGRLEWVFPKGHLEKGESAEQTAVREVREETGLQARVVAPLGEIDYWFLAGNRRVHKTVRHFVLEAVGGALSSADAEVTEVAWFPLEQLPDRLRYVSERRLLDLLPEALRDALPDSA